MQLVIDIKDESLVEKIIKFLGEFKRDGVEIKNISSTDHQEFNDQYIEDNWREILLGTHSANLDDDERLYKAAARFYNEKYSD